MRKLLLVVAAMLAGCGSSADVNVTGRWTGFVTSTLGATYATTINANQSGADVSGSYTTSFGGTGSVSGNVDGRTLHFTVTVTTPGCPGTMNGTGTVDAAGGHMAVTYSGSSCGGSESGTGTLTKG